MYIYTNIQENLCIEKIILILKLTCVGVGFENEHEIVLEHFFFFLWKLSSSFSSLSTLYVFFLFAYIKNSSSSSVKERLPLSLMMVKEIEVFGLRAKNRY